MASPMSTRSMDEGDSKAGGASGILSGILFILAFAVAYNFPASSSQADATLAGFSSMQNSLFAASILIGLVVLFAIPFYLSLRNAFGGKADLAVRTGTIFSSVGIIITAVTIIGEVVALAILKDAYAQAGPSRTAAVVVAQVAIGLGTDPVGTTLLGAGLAAYGFAMVRSSRFPHWLGYVGIVGGILLALGFLPIPGLFALFYGAFILLLLWIFATGAYLWRSRVSKPAA